MDFDCVLRNSLGNSDIEEKTKNLTPLVANLNSTILSSNVIINEEQAKQKVQKSVIKDIQGAKIGIVGYLTPKSSLLDSTGNIEYINEVIAVQDEVNKLKEQGVKIIIALGQSETAKDIEIASEVDGIDLIISGHKNIFFSNGTNAEDNFETTIKPLVVYQKSGKIVPIVKSYAYNKYLGKITVSFNSDGEIADYRVDSILLDESVPQDLDMSKIVKSANEAISPLNTPVGNTLVALDGDTCGLEECNLGNLVLDSIVFYYAARFQGARWTDASIAIMHGGAFTGTIAPDNRPASVSKEDLLTSIPESDNLVAVTMNGTVFNEMLEHSVYDYTKTNPSGKLLQFSGIRITYDLEKEPGSRIVSALVRCWDCYVPQYFVIDDWRTYKILMPSSLADGNHGYAMLIGLPKQDLSYDAVTCTSEFIQLRSPVYPEIADRIVLQNRDAAPDSAASLTSTFIILLPIYLCVFRV